MAKIESEARNINNITPRARDEVHGSYANVLNPLKLLNVLNLDGSNMLFLGSFDKLGGFENVVSLDYKKLESLKDEGNTRETPGKHQGNSSNQ